MKISSTVNCLPDVSKAKQIENNLKNDGLYNGKLCETSSESIYNWIESKPVQIRIYAMPSWSSILYGMGYQTYAN